jgi:predicted MFS family arabinose efflux permease
LFIRLQVGTAYGWRATFAIEAAAMLPLAALTLLAPPVELRSRKAAAGAGGRAGDWYIPELLPVWPRYMHSLSA